MGKEVDTLLDSVRYTTSSTANFSSAGHEVSILSKHGPCSNSQQALCNGQKSLRNILFGVDFRFPEIPTDFEEVCMTEILSNPVLDIYIKINNLSTKRSVSA